MSTRRSRWMIGLAVASFWVVMMGFLTYRELGDTVFPTAPPPSPKARDLSEASETWMGIFAKQKRVGHLRVSKAPETRGSRPGMARKVEARAELDLMGRGTDLDVRGSVWRPRDVAAAEFEFAVMSGDYRVGISGELSGGLLSAVVSTEGENRTFTVPVDEKLVFSSGIGESLELPALEVGEEAHLESFNPLTLRKTTLRLRCTARETIELGTGPVPTRRLDVRTSGVSSQVWIGEDGEVVKMTTPFGLTLQRIRPLETDVEDRWRE